MDNENAIVELLKEICNNQQTQMELLQYDLLKLQRNLAGITIVMGISIGSLIAGKFFGW